jgi:hypothetical protein
MDPVPIFKFLFGDGFASREEFSKLKDIILKFFKRHVRFHFIKQGKGELHRPIIARDHMIKGKIEGIFVICHIKLFTGVLANKAITSNMIFDFLNSFLMNLPIVHTIRKVRTAATMTGLRRKGPLAAEIAFSKMLFRRFEFGFDFVRGHRGHQCVTIFSISTQALPNGRCIH